MTPVRPGPPTLQGLPLLTEVIALAPAAEQPAASGPAEPLPLIGAAAVDEEQLVQRVLTDLQRHADLMLEYRLREALTPVLARLTETLVREVRVELAATLRDVVVRAVSQEVARQRGR